MHPLQARLEEGRFVLDQPTTLPDGMVIDLVADEFGLEGWRMLDVDLVAEQIVLIAPSGQVLQFDVAVTVDTSPL